LNLRLLYMAQVLSVYQEPIRMKPTKLRLSQAAGKIAIRLSIAALVAYCIMLGNPPSIAAQDASLKGSWRHSTREAEVTQRSEAINQATQGLGPLLRDRARQHLREATITTRELNVTDETVEITSAVNKRPVTVTIDGPPVRISGEQGEASMQVRRDDGKLVLTARIGGATRTTVFTVSDDGTELILQTSLVSPKLEEPIRYTDTFVRR
jgi:hypothetical protein